MKFKCRNFGVADIAPILPARMRQNQGVKRHQLNDDNRTFKDTVK